MNKAVFFDIDGVLNSGDAMSNGYCRIDSDKAERLNRILDETGAVLVIHSAWRYLVLLGNMTLRGFGDLLSTHGVRLYNPPDFKEMRLHGVTRLDEGNGSEDDRAKQIVEYAAEHGFVAWVAIDDLKLDLPRGRFIQTNRTVGITDAHADAMIGMITSSPDPTKEKSE